MTDSAPTTDELERYASGTLDWSVLRDRGVAYGDVLAGLGRLGLKLPNIPIEGPNREARLRGIAMLRQRLEAEP